MDDALVVINISAFLNTESSSHNQQMLNRPNCHNKTKYCKVPPLRVMKGSYFSFGSPQQQVDMHAKSKNTFKTDKKMHICL